MKQPQSQPPVQNDKIRAQAADFMLAHITSPTQQFLAAAGQMELNTTEMLDRICELVLDTRDNTYGYLAQILAAVQTRQDQVGVGDTRERDQMALLLDAHFRPLEAAQQRYEELKATVGNVLSSLEGEQVGPDELRPTIQILRAAINGDPPPAKSEASNGQRTAPA